MIKKIIGLMLILIGLCPFVGNAENKVLKVGVALGDPFVIYNNGEFTGVAIDTWKDIADDENLKYVFVNMGEHIDEAIKSLASGKIDVLVGPIVVTYDRLKLVDFTQPFYLNQIALVVHKKRIDFLNAFGNIFDHTIVSLLVFMILFFLLYLHVYWYYELKPKPGNESYWNGITESFWLHSLDIDLGVIPTHKRTRQARLVWILLLALFFSSITAAITSALTVALTDQYASYNTVDEFKNKQIVAVVNTAPYDIAKKLGFNVLGVNSRDEAVRLLLNKKVAAYIDYYAIANYYINQHELNHYLSLSNLTLQRNTFSFALPYHSPYRTLLNLKLREHQETGVIKLICEKYFMNNEKANLNCEI